MNARGRPKPSRMNKTEQAYADRLELLKGTGEVVWYRFEPIKLRLAEGAWYKPDFAVMLADGLIEFHEVKGFWREAARVRIKVAAEEHWMFRFVAVKKLTKNRGWQTEEFG